MAFDFNKMFDLTVDKGELDKQERLLYKVLQAQGVLLNEIQDLKADISDLKSKQKNETQ